MSAGLGAGVTRLSKIRRVVLKFNSHVDILVTDAHLQRQEAMAAMMEQPQEVPMTIQVIRK